MKLMNEIESEVDGKVVEILLENAQPVEYGEPLLPHRAAVLGGAGLIGIIFCLS